MNTSLDDVVGLDNVKQCLYECIILPSINPLLFQGLRAPPKGILLFGPPGNGKTMIAKAVASSSKASFFNISASSLTSRYVGEAEKLVKGLFSIARERQPSIIFIDEIDSILSARSSDENEASKRLKTEFLVAFDGVGSSDNDQILVMAATNLPQSLDEAVLRRFNKRIYVPLPDETIRASLVQSLLSKQRNSLSNAEIRDIVLRTDGYSASDITAVCKEAAMGPLRELHISRLAKIDNIDQISPITHAHVRKALQIICPTVSERNIQSLEQWNGTFGTKVYSSPSNISSSECVLS